MGGQISRCTHTYTHTTLAFPQNARCRGFSPEELELQLLLPLFGPTERRDVVCPQRRKKKAVTIIGGVFSTFLYSPGCRQSRQRSSTGRAHPSRRRRASCLATRRAPRGKRHGNRRKSPPHLSRHVMSCHAMRHDNMRFYSCRFRARCGFVRVVSGQASSSSSSFSLSQGRDSVSPTVCVLLRTFEYIKESVPPDVNRTPCMLRKTNYAKLRLRLTVLLAGTGCWHPKVTFPPQELADQGYLAAVCCNRPDGYNRRGKE